MTSLIQQTQEEQQVIAKHFTDSRIEEISALSMDKKSDYLEVTDFFAMARKYRTAIEAKRKHFTAPLREQINEINHKAKTMTDALDRGILIANRQLGQYTNYLKRKEEQKKREILEMASSFGVDVPIEISESPKPEATATTTIVTKKTSKYKVVNLSKVPRKYLTIDDEAVKRDIRLGVRKITGLEIYDEETITLRKK